MKLLIALRSEILKTKRTASFYFTLIIAALVPLILMLNVLTGGGDVDAIHKGSLNAVFDLGMERTGLVFFPMFVILVCTLLPQIEYRNNTWKQVFTAPHTKGTVFIAKFLNINRLILLFLLATLVYMSLVIVAIHFCNPERHIFNQPFDAAKLFISIGNSYVTMLAICAFQFWLGLRFRNFIIPTAIGFVLWITGMMMVLEFKSDMIEYFPYSFPTFSFIYTLQPKLAQVAWTSVAYATVFLLLGFLDFRRRRLTA
jgi:lantibiotic transport system permease protein